MFGMVGHSNLGLPTRSAAKPWLAPWTMLPSATKALPRSPPPMANSPENPLPDYRGPRSDQSPDRPLGCQGRPCTRPRTHRPSPDASFRAGRVPGYRPFVRLRGDLPLLPDRADHLQPCGTGDIGREECLVNDVAHLIFPDVQTIPSDAKAGAPRRRTGNRQTVRRRPRRRAQNDLSVETALYRTGHGAKDVRHQVIALAALGAPVATFKGKA